MSTDISKLSGRIDLDTQLKRVTATRARAAAKLVGREDLVWKNQCDMQQVRKMANLKKLDPEHECTVLTVANHKGGVCKTTMCFALANYLFNEGYRVLVIDTDPQGSLSSKFDVSGNDPDNEDNILASVYNGLRNFKSVIDKPLIVNGNVYSAVDPCILLLPGSQYLVPTVQFAESLNGGVLGCREVFCELIDVYRKYFDYIIFDTTPLIENSTCGAHALSASDGVIVPIYGVESVENIKWTVKVINEVCKKSVKVLFTFPKYREDDVKLTRDFEEACVNNWLPMCDDPVIKKGEEWERGHDERRNTVYRFMRKVLPYNTCETGIPDVQRIGNGSYNNLDRSYKRLYDDMFREIVIKMGDSTVDDLCIRSVWDSKYTELRKYIDIVRDYVTVNTPKRTNKVEFEE